MWAQLTQAGWSFENDFGIILLFFFFCFQEKKFEDTMPNILLIEVTSLSFLSGSHSHNAEARIKTTVN